MANSVDSDQMPHSVVFDLGLHCLLCIVPIHRIIMVNKFIHMTEYRKLSVLLSIIL